MDCGLRLRDRTSEKERGHRSEIKHFCGKTTKLPVTLIQGQFCVSPLWCRRLWLVSWSLRSTSYPGQGERTPQEHCLAAAANQNTKLTHSTAQTANQSSTMDTFWTDLTFRTNTQQSMGVSAGRAIRSCSGYRNGFGEGCCLLEAEKGGGEGGAGGGGLVSPSSSCQVVWGLEILSHKQHDEHKDAQSSLSYFR